VDYLNPNYSTVGLAADFGDAYLRLNVLVPAVAKYSPRRISAFSDDRESRFECSFGRCSGALVNASEEEFAASSCEIIWYQSLQRFDGSRKRQREVITRMNERSGGFLSGIKLLTRR